MSDELEPRRLGASEPARAIPASEAEAILDALGEGLFTVDASWRITRFNPAAERITGFAREEAIGRRCWEIFRTDVCETACVLREAIERGGRVDGRAVNILDSANREVPIEASAAVFEDRAGSFAGGVETFRDISEVRQLRDEVRRIVRLHDIPALSPAMLELVSRAPRAAASSRPLAIVGPAGAGKTTLAAALHAEGARRDEPLRVLNARRLSPGLMSEELEEALTGEEGSLVIAGLEALPRRLQSRLLAWLDEAPAGPPRLFVTARVSLDEAAARRRVVRALARALESSTLLMPALAERIEDLPALAEQILSRQSERRGAARPTLSPEALRALLAYRWPGNVRELDEVLAHALALSEGARLEASDLPEPVRGAGALGLGSARREPRSERATILGALERAGWNKVRAAAELGVSRATLWRRMNELGIPLRPDSSRAPRTPARRPRAAEPERRGPGSKPRRRQGG